MDVNTRRLRYFLAVVEYGHFGRAAASLHLSTTALSEQIRKLEDEMAVRLLDRTSRGARPTEIGVEVAEHARAVLRAAGLLVEAVGRHRRRETGVLRLGFVTMGAGELTPHLVAAFDRRAPGHPVELVHLDYAHQLRSVLNGEVDAGIVRGPIQLDRLRAVELAHEPRMVMLSAAHPLAGRGSVTCYDIRDEVRVTTDGVPDEWRCWWSLDPGPDGTSPPYGPTVHSFDEQLETAAAGVGVRPVGGLGQVVDHCRQLRDRRQRGIEGGQVLGAGEGLEPQPQLVEPLEVGVHLRVGDPVRVGQVVDHGSHRPQILVGGELGQQLGVLHPPPVRPGRTHHEDQRPERDQERRSRNRPQHPRHWRHLALPEPRRLPLEVTATGPRTVLTDVGPPARIRGSGRCRKMGEFYNT